jgi:hypothetical protein
VVQRFAANDVVESASKAHSPKMSESFFMFSFGDHIVFRGFAQSHGLTDMAQRVTSKLVTTTKIEQAIFLLTTYSRLPISLTEGYANSCSLWGSFLSFEPVPRRSVSIGVPAVSRVDVRTRRRQGLCQPADAAPFSLAHTWVVIPVIDPQLSRCLLHFVTQNCPLVRRR